ncbi:MAG TPA: hypothetical protein PLI27_08375 [Ignavibacteriales bacterium]|nr:hypothetical protein [Ignavibacteriales bacterium]HOL80433.1 hypothetical protein [Ignavibacteriales bacterium]HOM64884.1 hypothetical protein [Ignavibacteriales bacterium]HPD68073.1 hypothetical protein [Ignavibacteriales bacterium]HPP32622.1 hypothetical protein [Ignavibacteriales bacterium]
MNKFLFRRLITIRSLILLNLNDEVINETKKLKKFNTKEDLSQIIENLEKQNFEQVVKLIDQITNLNEKIDLFETNDIKTLNFYLKQLNKKLNKLRKRKENIERKIIDFGILYNLEVGTIIERILFLRKELVKYELEQDPNNEELKDEFRDAFDDYEKYHAEIEEMKRKNLLNEEQLKDLKSKFRKATKLCHPDLIDESMKETAEKIFSDLKAAYENNDIETVDKILEMLETQDILIPKTEEITDKDKLIAEIKKTNYNIKQEELAIKKLQESETYRLIKSFRDIRDYIESTKKQMQVELDALEEIYKEKELFYSKGNL